jgi:rhodanese-related sulfurtransferase
MDYNHEKVICISYVDVLKLSKNRNYVIVDIRSEYEYEKKHIHGAISVPEYKLPYKIKEMSTRKKYIFICEKGIKSKAIAELFNKKGFMAMSLLGGMDSIG